MAGADRGPASDQLPVELGFVGGAGWVGVVVSVPVAVLVEPGLVGVVLVELEPGSAGELDPGSAGPELADDDDVADDDVAVEVADGTELAGAGLVC